MEEKRSPFSPVEIEDALRDLETRTLARLDGYIARLVYLASTRDYNSGRYEHDGLSFRFTKRVAEQALAVAHREVFVSLALCPLEDLVHELERYIRSGCAEPAELVTTWSESEAYRILPPAPDDPLTIKLFESNVKIALAIVALAWKEDPPGQGPQSASQLK
jgi:hypothetical protein